jgi:CRISPR type I-E-associated protein CasB/Cse2
MTQQMADAFVRQLVSRKNDRGAMATIRSGRSESTRFKMYRGGCMPQIDGYDVFGSRPCELVASLFASHLGHASIGNFGVTCRILSGEKDSMDKRFDSILEKRSCEFESLASSVSYFVRIAASKGVPVDFAKLLVDLCNWDDETKMSWCRQFHSIKGGKNG